VCVKIELKTHDPPYTYIGKEHQLICGNGNTWLVSNIFSSFYINSHPFFQRRIIFFPHSHWFKAI